MGKPTMELIKNEKLRNSTFQKRKKSLKKKLEEFQILCNVDACMILYGPADGNHRTLDVFPEKAVDVMKIIARYTSSHDQHSDQQALTSRKYSLSDYYENRAVKVKDGILKTRRAAYKAKYPGWDDRLLKASTDELMKILSSVDGKIEHVHLLSDTARVNQQQSTATGPFDPQSYPGNNVSYQQHDQELLERNYIGQLHNLNAFNQFCFDHAARGVPSYFDPRFGLFETRLHANRVDQNENLCIGYDPNKASGHVMLPATIDPEGSNKIPDLNERIYNFDDLLMLNRRRF